MKTVVVLSPPRSGSSLLTGVLHRLGVNMGKEEDLLKGKSINDYGCYENADFLRFNFEVLGRADSVIYPVIIPDDKKIKKSMKEMEPLIRELIKKYEKKVWGWKNPTSLYTIPFMHKYLKNPYYIFLKRNSESIVHSQLKVTNSVGVNFVFRRILPLLSLKMIVRLGLRFLKLFIKQGNVLKNEEMIRRVTIDSCKRIDSFIKGKKSLTINFDELVKKPESVINKLVRFLNIKPTKDQLRDALSFVHPELIHF